jgi:hypothetical protein
MNVPVLVLVAAIALLQAAPQPRTIAKGPMSGIAEPRQATARSAAELTALWRAHGASDQVPIVDFSREMVVGVFLGTRRTAGYGVEIVRAVGNAGVLTVAYVETAPSKGALTAQVLTSPYHLVALPRHDGEIRFQAVDK